MNASFYSIEIAGTDFPELSDIIDKFNEFHSERGGPVGDSLDLQIDSILVDVCLHFNIQYTSTLDNSYFFFPMNIDVDDVIKMLEKKLEEDD